MICKRPKYRVAADRIVEEVCRPLRVGDRLPTLPDLCRTYDVSEITIKKALALLVQHGLIRRVPRKGTILVRQVDAAAPTFGRRTTLSVLTLQGWRFADAAETLARRFGEQRPSLEFAFHRVENERFEAALREREYDLILPNIWWMREILTRPSLRERFLPLDDLPGLWWDESAYRADVLRWCRDEQGRTFCLPVTVSSIVNALNENYPGADPTLFDDGPTFEEYTERLARACAPAEGVSAFPFVLPMSWNRWPIVLRSFGAEIFSPDGRRCRLDTPEAIAGIRALLDMMYRRKVCLPLAVINGTQLRAGPYNLFALGKFLCTWVTYAAMHTEHPFPLRLAPLPRAAKPFSHLHLEGVMVGRQGAPREAIRDFLNYLQQPEAQLHFSETCDGFTCQPALLAPFAARKAESVPGFQSFIDALDTAEPVVAAPRQGALQFVDERLYPVWLGIEPPEAACRELTREVNRRLDDGAFDPA